VTEWRMRALITGIGGFVGSHLAEFLLAQGYEVIGIVRDLDRVAKLHMVRAQVTLFEADVRDRARLEAIVAEVRPEQVYHLAARAFVPDGEVNPQPMQDVNVEGTRTLLDAAYRRAPHARVLLASTARVYGSVTADARPIPETSPLRPIGPYAVSKAHAEALWRAYHRRGLAGVIVRSFNHIGPRQSPAFVCADFARQIAEAEAGRRDPIVRGGNLDIWRDFRDVRDAVRAYWLALTSDAGFSVVNVCSGQARSIGELLQGLLRLSRTPLSIVVDERKWRRSDAPVLVGDPRRLQRLGWAPRIPWERTLADVLAEWRARFREGDR